MLYFSRKHRAQGNKTSVRQYTVNKIGKYTYLPSCLSVKYSRKILSIVKLAQHKEEGNKWSDSVKPKKKKKKRPKF